MTQDAKPLEPVLIVGDGGWGTAMSLLLADAGRDVRLWSYDPEYAELMRTERKNPRYLPGFDVPEGITVSSDFEALADGAALLISAIPTAYLRDVWAAHTSGLDHDVPIVSLSKGMEKDTLLRPTEVLSEVTDGHRSIAVLSGPNIAREIAAGQPAASVVSSADPELSKRIQATLSGETFRVYSNPDPVGVELGGVLKNVIALAAGMCDGLDLGVNAKAALVSRGLLEMARLGVALGGQRATFFGLSGLGDLMTTCYSEASRNRTFGERLGRGEQLEDISASMQQVAESVKSVGPIHDLMKRHGLSGPITDQMYAVVHEGKSPKDVVSALMTRDHKDEAEDLGL